MAYTTIDKPKLHFEGIKYLGSSSAVTVSGLQFQPDWVWIKDRDNGNNHCLVDAVRGVGKYLKANGTAAEIDSSSQSISAFTSDGFTVGTANPANESASTTRGFISWNWKANGQGSSNTDGSINTAYTSVNSTAGFSISKYTGTGSAGATFGHGLGVAPKVVIIKKTNNTGQWCVGSHYLDSSWDYFLFLDDAAGNANADNVFNDVAPSSSTVTLGNHSFSNNNGDEYIAYCFAEKTGYSKFGSYTGSGSTDGPYIYLGFKPAFFMTRRYDSGNSWNIFDNKRSATGGTNEITYNLNADGPDAEQTSTTYNDVDFYANGVHIREDNNGVNAASGTYFYMAFAEMPIVSSGNVPATAR